MERCRLAGESVETTNFLLSFRSTAERLNSGYSRPSTSGDNTMSASFSSGFGGIYSGDMFIDEVDT